MKSIQSLKAVLHARSKVLDREIERRLLESREIVIFGSYAAGLANKRSDLDVFCLGDSRMHFKSSAIELLVLPEYDAYSDLWLGSELANHISAYGVPLGPRPGWFDLTGVSPSAVARKEKRIASYIRALKTHSSALSTAARARYELKLRREFLRLQFLRDGKAVPPTKILDSQFPVLARSDTKLVHHISSLQQDQIRELFPGSIIAELVSR